MAESRQHTLDRVRKPRVQITYDVETGDARETKELAFVAGIMADLSGDNAKSLPKLNERKFVEVDRDNFNDVLDKAAPTLQLKVDNQLAAEGEEATQMSVNLEFHSMADFSPAKVAEQVAPLKELLDMRKRLDEILAKASSSTKVEDMLSEVLASTEKVQALAKELGIEAPAGEGK